MIRSATGKDREWDRSKPRPSLGRGAGRGQAVWGRAVWRIRSTERATELIAVMEREAWLKRRHDFTPPGDVDHRVFSVSGKQRRLFAVGAGMLRGTRRCSDHAVAVLVMVNTFGAIRADIQIWASGCIRRKGW